MIAHVGGLPLEEILPSLTGAGAGLLVARAWMMLRRFPTSERMSIVEVMVRYKVKREQQRAGRCAPEKRIVGVGPSKKL